MAAARIAAARFAFADEPAPRRRWTWCAGSASSCAAPPRSASTPIAEETDDTDAARTTCVCPSAAGRSWASSSGPAAALRVSTVRLLTLA